MVDLDTAQTLRFEVTGTFAVPKDAVLLYDAFGEIRGYETNGREVSLVVGLEVTEDGGVTYSYITNENEMGEKLNSQLIDYDVTSFFETQNSGG